MVKGGKMTEEIKSNSFTLTNNATGESWDFPVYNGTIGPSVIDFSKLYSSTGHFSFDPGYTSTASCKSKITFIDGDKGQLMYRGYPIEQLAENADYMEVCYALMYGDMPNAEELKNFTTRIKSHTLVNEQIKNIFQAFPRKSHPMAIMAGVCSALAAFYHDDAQMLTDPENRYTAIYRIVAKLPTVAAMAYKYAYGLPYIYPRNDLSYAENFLHMMFATPKEPYHVDPVLARAMDLILILHADHEQNASTSTVRMAGSTMANPYAVMAAGVAALWGPSHGGANEAVLRMLDEIGSVDHVDEYMRKVKDPNDPTRLMGFGHRVYKNYDPRAKIMRRTCNEVLDALGKRDEPKLALAMRLEQIALEDPYFVERRLYPNVDFYSGIIFEAMGIPRNAFTVIFAVARAIGWISQWNEMLDDPKLKIARPRQLYLGDTSRDFKGIGQR